MKILIITILLFFSIPKYFDNTIDFKIKEYSFGTYKIITNKKKILAELKNSELILLEEKNKLKWNFSCKFITYDYYPYNHRQYFKIKINNIILKIKIMMHCHSENDNYKVNGVIYKNLKLKNIKNIQLQIIPIKWYKCDFI